MRQLIAWMPLLLALATPGHTADAAAVPKKASRLWQLAAQEQARLDQRGIILEDASLNRYLHGVTTRLWKQLASPLNMPRVKIITDTRIDAHAYPNGVCYMSTGMLDILENESQLAMILAHEMIHYVRQHTAALYNHFQPSRLQDDGGNAHPGSTAGSLTMWHTIDAAERQADREGLAILQAAGYCEKEVLPLMSNLAQCVADQGHTQSVYQLKQRAARFKMRVDQAGDHSTCSPSTGTDTDGYRDSVAPALIANAQQALRGGDWDQADRSISRFLVSQPLNARAHYLKGEILRRRNGSNLDAACINAFEKALDIDPTFPLTHRALGELHYKAGRYQLAKPYFEAFLSLAPQDSARAFIKGYLKQCQN
jgi:predicted Zn-dependent protease